MPPTILAFFNDGKTRFVNTDSVTGMISGEPGFGLGPRYNSRSCARCHSQPAVGGTSPFTNPQVADATADGATNTVPSFITSTTAVKEARFVFFTDASGNPITTSPNGGVEDLYTIAGRTDAGSCTSSVISQPDFVSAALHNNIIFRIPTPVFGAGLIENIEENELLSAGSNPYGISHEFNRNGNDGTISRFGWKAQNKSLEIFAGEAYNVEMGVSNELFTQERPLPEEDRASGLPAQCRTNGTPEDHTNFNQTGAATGRLSSSDPNLQNIPIRTPRGEEIRRGFVPRDGWQFLVADYSQIELRIMAHLSGDPGFIEAFHQGGDIHRQTAALIFSVSVDQVTAEMRARAKTINFATIYGQGPFALSRQLGISQEDAKSFIARYFERFAGVRAFLDRQIQLAREYGYVETIFKRRRYIPEIKDRNFNMRAYGERNAQNSPLQGSAADLIKLAMVRIHTGLRERKLRSRMLLQVHDELVFEGPPEEIETLGRLVRDHMEHVVELRVPLVVDIGVGPNWLDAKH